jgi:hypothetical protein
MKYADKLLDPRWQKRRLEVFERDGWKCLSCGNSKETLVVHHLCYLPKTDPWDHPPIYLLTLCNQCHERGIGGPTDVVYYSILNERRKFLESFIESEYDPIISRELDCVLFLLGVHEDGK